MTPFNALEAEIVVQAKKGNNFILTDIQSVS